MYVYECGFDRLFTGFITCMKLGILVLVTHRADLLLFYAS